MQTLFIFQKSEWIIPWILNKNPLVPKVLNQSSNMVEKGYGYLGGEAVWVNGTPAGVNTDTLTYTIYPNPYITVNGNRWTKHYYVGGERIASRTGTLGDFNSMSTGDNYSAGHGIQTVSYDGMIAAEEDSVAAMYERFGMPYGVLHASARGNADILYFPITKENDNTAETAPLNRNHPHIADGGQVYYFQRDHLGSTMSVTDSLGAYVQQVEYTPWGEVFVERNSGSSGYGTPYLFNGKELDNETGLYYYGARYYDPKLSLWYSTDHDQEKYPYVGSYCYTLSNPINSIDPNGNLVIFINGMHLGDGGKAKYWKGLNISIMDFVKDNHQRYYDGSLGGASNTLSHGILTGNLNPYERFAEGVIMGSKDAERIFNSLKQGETIKIFTHSMGAAYGKGFITGLKAYAKLKNIDINSILEFEMDLAPYQSIMQSAVIGVKTVSIGHCWDGVAGLSVMPFAENHNTRKDKFSLNPLKEHSVNSFTIKELKNYMPVIKGIKITNGKTWEQYGIKEEQ